MGTMVILAMVDQKKNVIIHSYYNWVKINQEWIMQCTALYGCWKEDY